MAGAVSFLVRVTRTGLRRTVLPLGLSEGSLGVPLRVQGAGSKTAGAVSPIHHIRSGDKGQPAMSLLVLTLVTWLRCWAGVHSAKAGPATTLRDSGQSEKVVSIVPNS